ncbi:hypothetical protein M8818_002953 [Zalaria obscura]|uniref:Uncharacterized protein n=1 Tax=Zalaria obscura TaxID=2024903 RepID=A0ACC3SHI2_9PEZI
MDPSNVPATAATPGLDEAQMDREKEDVHAPSLHQSGPGTEKTTTVPIPTEEDTASISITSASDSITIRSPELRRRLPSLHRLKPAVALLPRHSRLDLLDLHLPRSLLQPADRAHLRCQRPQDLGRCRWRSYCARPDAAGTVHGVLPVLPRVRCHGWCCYVPHLHPVRGGSGAFFQPEARVGVWYCDGGGFARRRYYSPHDAPPLRLRRLRLGNAHTRLRLHPGLLPLHPPRALAPAPQTQRLDLAGPLHPALPRRRPPNYWHVLHRIRPLRAANLPHLVRAHRPRRHRHLCLPAQRDPERGLLLRPPPAGPRQRQVGPLQHLHPGADAVHGHEPRVLAAGVAAAVPVHRNQAPRHRLRFLLRLRLRQQYQPDAGLCGPAVRDRGAGPVLCDVLHRRQLRELDRGPDCRGAVEEYWSRTRDN